MKSEMRQKMLTEVNIRFYCHNIYTSIPKYYVLICGTKVYSTF